MPGLRGTGIRADTGRASVEGGITDRTNWGSIIPPRLPTYCCTTWETTPLASAVRPWVIASRHKPVPIEQNAARQLDPQEWVQHWLMVSRLHPPTTASPGGRQHPGRTWGVGVGTITSAQIWAGSVQQFPSHVTTPGAVSPQVPARQVAVWHCPVGVGQSAGEWHWQRRRPMASFGPQRPEQQLACSRQIVPTAVQVRASPDRSPNSPSALPARPARTRRRELDDATVLTRASKRAESTGSPFTMRGRFS
jgi:hypothetical protein